MSFGILTFSLRNGHLSCEVAGASEKCQHQQGAHEILEVTSIFNSGPRDDVTRNSKVLFRYASALEQQVEDDLAALCRVAPSSFVNRRCP